MTAVLWLNHHPETVDARGMWDEAMLNAVFDGSLWRPVGGHQFEHYTAAKDVPDGAGAVVVVAGRYHHRPRDVSLVQSEIQRFPWVLLVVVSDEAHQFPVELIGHPNMRLWIQTPDPDRQAHTDAFGFGVGWPPHARDELAATEDVAMARPLDGYFSGQVTHIRREQCIAGLANAWDADVVVNETEGFTQGVDHPTYFRGLASAKVAPCPSGPQTVDSFRVWEALEAGCVPLADTRTPDRFEESYWSHVFGQAPLFPLIHRWDEVAEVVRQVVERWPAIGTRVFAWWQGQKRRMAYRMRDDLRALAEWAEIDSGDLGGLITVLMPTSPIPAHPSTEVIDETLQSVRDQLGADVEVIVMCDGVRESQSVSRGPAYDAYLQRLLWSTNRAGQTLPLVFRDHTHQATMTRAALNLVQTPFVLFVEHDTPLIGEIDWAGCCAAIGRGDADVIRFHHEADILPPHRHLMLDRSPRTEDIGIPAMRTVQWSQRPHLSSLAYYRHILSSHFSEDARTMIEDVMYGVVSHAWERDGEQGWFRHRLWLYTPEGSMVRSRHLDGRGDDPKFTEEQIP